MGMESFSFDIVCDTQVTKESILQCINDKFKLQQYYTYSNSIFKRKIIDSNRYIINDSLVADIRTDAENTIVGIEACFANYSCNVLEAFKLYNILKNVFENVMPKYGDNCFYELNCDETCDPSFERFQEWIASTHIKKYEDFKERYGKIEINVLPCEFYGFVRKYKRRN